MSSLFDYLIWRGDLSFGNASLTPPDALIFSMLAYIDFEGVVSREANEAPVRLSDAIGAYFARPTITEGSISANHEHLLHMLTVSPRFSALRTFGAKKVFDKAHGVQFGAVSFLLPGQNIFVAFEGTNDTLVGWKEDFRMSYECPVPAQLMAAQYLREVAAAYPLRRIFLGGHSKGGNLAMFAAVNAGEHLRPRIRAVYNNDGPGFCDSTVTGAAYAELRERIMTYLPESSIVAVLLEHDTNYKVVKSTNKGLLQHDGYSWEMEGTDFVYTDERTAFGKKTEAIVDHFVRVTSPERRRRFCEALFTILEATEHSTVSGILGGKRQSLKNMLGAYADMPDEMRVLLSETLAVLVEGRRAADGK
ncbi:MAG: DUF2974 domain-containing protein [Clostridia bacterium]|nr:DUF2974 domain-containing protein [Clostridia bacterium]